MSRHNATGRHIFDIGDSEEVLHVFLFEGISLRFESFVQPVGVLYTRYRIHTLLQRCWNRDNLLNGSAKTLLVVAPIKKLAQIIVL